MTILLDISVHFVTTLNTINHCMLLHRYNTNIFSCSFHPVQYVGFVTDSFPATTNLADHSFAVNQLEPTKNTRLLAKKQI